MIEVDLNVASLPLDWDELFSRKAPVDIEIGSGKGAFLLDLAIRQPDHNYLAVERAPKYHNLTCQRAGRRGVTNVRLLQTTAEDLLNRLVRPETVERLFVLFPDPWPKKRHHKRRFFTPENVATLSSVLVPGGLLYVKSDHPEYSDVIEASLRTCADLEPIDTTEAFQDLPLTGFERKYIVEGRMIRAFALKKRGS
ncbi:MAG: tRNA (guanosine(46)-N7)-methyltransferase TrmB [bacterium]|nr:tRNA (guanosine(46)-N7)-methyltransferase TrmB [bacterium]